MIIVLVVAMLYMLLQFLCMYLYYFFITFFLQHTMYNQLASYLSNVQNAFIVTITDYNSLHNTHHIYTYTIYIHQQVQQFMVYMMKFIIVVQQVVIHYYSMTENIAANRTVWCIPLPTQIEMIITIVFIFLLFMCTTGYQILYLHIEC